MRSITLSLLFLLPSLFALEAMIPTSLQFGCRSILDYEHAEHAKGYGAGNAFADAGCVYLKGMDLVIKKHESDYAQVCLSDDLKMCYWTLDTSY